jgi:hypothetical protein
VTKREILAEAKAILDRLGELIEVASRPNDNEDQIVSEAKALTERHRDLMNQLKPRDS